MRQGFVLILCVLLPTIVIFGIFHDFSAPDFINEIFPSNKALQYKTQHVSSAHFSFSMLNFLAALSSLSFLLYPKSTAAMILALLYSQLYLQY